MNCYSDPTNPSGRYILDKRGEPIPEPDLFRWGRWFEYQNRIVKQENVGRSSVSTVFLGLDHNFCDEGPPILWETMVFGGKLDKETDRCGGSREQAEAMHQEMCKRVRVAEWPRVPIYRLYGNTLVPFLDDQLYDWR